MVSTCRASRARSRSARADSPAQRLAPVSIGNGSTATVIYAGTVNATSGAGLVFNNADGTYNFNGIVTLSGTAGIGITNGSSGTFTFAAGSSITNPSATAFNVSTGSPTITYNGAIHQTGSQRAVNIASTTGGSITFTGPVNASGTSTGISITNSVGTSVTFTGGVALTLPPPARHSPLRTAAASR